MPKPQPAIIDALNAHFRDGKPSSNLAEVGLILRQFDATEDDKQPWRGCPGHVVAEGAGNECRIYGNRFSASIVNAALFRSEKKVQLFSKLDAGVIYSPRVTLNCVYGGDGGTRKLPEDGCGKEFCDPSQSKRDSWCNGLPHHSSHIGDVLANLRGGGYNEIFINTQSIDDLLPESVVAIFYPRGSVLGVRRAREVHRDFVRKFKLDARTHPLVRFDLNNLERPFLADEG